VNASIGVQSEMGGNQQVRNAGNARLKFRLSDETGGRAPQVSPSGGWTRFRAPQQPATAPPLQKKAALRKGTITAYQEA
jgi:hypothetical protein